MSIVCFDTHVLIWGVKKEAKPEQECKIEQAEYLIQKLHTESTSVIVPSIVLAEILCGVDPSKQGRFTNALYSLFRIVPFDAPASAKYAQLWHSLGNEKRLQIREEEGITRRVLKADLMIVATALSRKAWCIYTEDGPLKRLAEGHIEVAHLPEPPPRQEPLFNDF